MTTLDVLLLESRPGDAAHAGTLLADAGHRVHRCWEDGVPTRNGGFAPCTALTGGTCPLDDGIDVALVVRSGVEPRAGDPEVGVRCALRARVPVVEDGADLLDPFAPWLAARVGDDVVGTCEAAARDALAPSAATVRDGLAPLLAAEGLGPDAVDVALEAAGDHLTVRLHGPDVPPRLRQALSVRAVALLPPRSRPSSRVDVAWTG